jgi:HYR domain-containing protein
MKNLKPNWIGILFISIFTLFNSPFIFSQCSLTCNSTVQISLDVNCLAEVSPDDILEGSSSGCNGTFSVQIFDASGDIIPTNPFVDGTYVGQILTTRVTHDASGNYCEGAIDVRDYIKPVITCSNLSLACNMSTHPDDIGYAIVTDNCDNNAFLSYSDNIFNPMCDPSAVQVINRTWTAEDASGNIAIPCVQTITLLRPILSNIQFPENRDDVESPSLDCINPDVSPSNTGYPTLEGIDLVTGSTCEIWVMYTDSDPIPLCQGSYHIIRTWTINDECGNNSVMDTQVIKVKDKTAPEINCPNDFTISASSNSCAAFVTIPAATATDNCSSNISFSITDPNGNLVLSNSVSNLPVGVHTFTYEATDDCGNTAQCTLDITVDDGVNPVVVCESSTTISLGMEGLTLVPANVFDDGSYDNCGPITFLARRMDNPECPGEDATTFDTMVPFYCCDVGNPVMVEMLVEDAIHRLSNSCMVEVIVQDKLNPLITCPPDTILDCENYPVDPLVTGEPYVYDNCGIAEVSYTDSLDLDICNTGMIFRTWTVTDVQGRLSTCLQKITLVDTIDPIIIFPSDIDVAECGDAEDTAITGAPMIDDVCGSFGVGKEDINLEFNGGCMIKIIRIWTVYDWCKDTTYTSVQVIQEFDNEPPVFDITPTDLTVECDAIPPADILTATDDCDNGVNTTMNETINPGTCEDEYFILREWITSDNCGNADTLTQTITVVDTTPPMILGESPDTTLNCDAIIPTPALMISDNCDTNVDLSMTENQIDGTCENEYTIVRTWIATDNCGNQSQVIQTIMIQDTIAPELFGVPVDISVECDMIPEPAIVTAIDNCDMAVEVTFNESIQNGTCPDNFSISRTWTATDNCGNQSAASQTIQVNDTTPPVLSGVPANLTVECGNVPPAANVTATDNCVPNIMVIFEEEIETGNCAEDITVIRTWTATDNCGNTVSAQQVITSTDTEAPVLSGVPANLTVECGNVPPAANVTAIDNCVPNIMVIFEEEIENGSCAEDITVTRTWTATDNCGNTVSAQQVITSADTEAPVLSGVPANLTVECGSVPPAANVTATDNCVPNIMVIFEEETETGNCAEDITVTRTWTATDNCGNTVSAQQVITSADTEAPVLSGVPANLTVECGNVPPAANVTATDNCVPNIMVIFEEEIETGNCAEDITVTRTWTATDNCGNTVSAQQVITSADTEAPVLSGVPANLTVECGNVPPAANVTATDNCVPNIMVFFEEEIENGNCAEDITVTRTWTATDNCGNTVSAQQVINSADTEAPVLSDLPPDMTVQCDAIPMPPEATATDNCDMNVELIFEEITTEQNCENEFVLLWIWTAIDNCGNTSADTTSIEVIDDTAPILFGVPSNITIECSEVMDPPFPTATDNCDTNPEVIFDELTTAPSCGGANKIFRTWAAVDNCGNQSIRTQIITLFDNTAPVFTSTPDDLTAECDNIPSPDVVTAEDYCENGVEFLVVDQIIEGACENNFTINRIYTALDSCGNTNTHTQVITVEDTTPPTIQCPVDVTLTIQSVGVCSVVESTLLSVGDNCDLGLTTTYEIDFGNDGSIDSTGTLGAFPFLLIAYPIGDNTVTFETTDNCGNTATCDRQITVIDVVPPAFFCNPQTVTLTPPDLTAFIVPSAFLLEPFLECCLDTLLFGDPDNPGQFLDTLFLDYDDYLESSMNNGIPISIFAIDCYGNQSSCTTKVFVLFQMVPPGYTQISGQIFTEEYEPLENIDVNIDGGMSETALTFEDGYYEFGQVPQGYNYYIEPFYNQNPSNGVSTLDVILMQRHILEIALLDSPYKIIAADVDRSGYVSTFDMIELRKLILGIIPTFQTNTSWRFVDANYLFPNAENPFTSSFPEFCSIINLDTEMSYMDFVGIKTGDLNNSAEVNVQGESESRNANTFHFNTEEQFLEKEEVYTVSIRASDFEKVLGFQFSLQFDPDDLEFSGIGKSNLPFFNLDNFGFNFTDQGILTCSWYAINEVSMKPDEVLFDLKFRAKSKGRLSSFISLNSAYTRAEIYQIGSKISNLDLQFNTSQKIKASFELFQNRPNPFKAETIIGFSLDESSETMFSVFNASGKMIYQRKEFYPEGYHEIIIRNEQLEGVGMYFYQLKTAEGNAQRRMILVE